MKAFLYTKYIELLRVFYCIWVLGYPRFHKRNQIQIFGNAKIVESRSFSEVIFVRILLWIKQVIHYKSQEYSFIMWRKPVIWVLACKITIQVKLASKHQAWIRISKILTHALKYTMFIVKCHQRHIIHLKVMFYLFLYIMWFVVRIVNRYTWFVDWIGSPLTSRSTALVVYVEPVERSLL